MSKGSETNVKMPEWLSKYYGGTAGRAENIADYFWQDLLPGGRIAGRTPTKEWPKDPGPDLPYTAEPITTNPIDPVTGKILPGGLGPTPAPTLPNEYLAEQAAGGVPRKKIPQLPPGGFPPGGDGDTGDAGGGFDIGQILGFRPEVTPGLSPYQQLVGKNIPELLTTPYGEGKADWLGDINMAEAGRSPTVSREDPQIEALRDLYEGSTKELLKNEATMGGYRRGSALPDVIAKRWQAELGPILEAQLGRKAPYAKPLKGLPSRRSPSAGLPRRGRRWR